MLTRRTATVTISAPEASCAWTMTVGEEYLPVPTIRRDENVLSAIVNRSTVQSLVLTIRNPQSAVRNPQLIRNPQSAIRNPQLIRNPQSAIRNFRNAPTPAAP